MVQAADQHARKFNWNTNARKIEHTWFADGELNVTVNCLDRHLQNSRPANRHHLAGRTGGGRQAHHLRGTARRGLQVCQCPQIARHQKGRPRGHLHAHDSRSRRGHARLRAHRRHSFGRLWRVQFRFAGRPHQRFRVQTAHHRQCLPARRQIVSAQIPRRCRPATHAEHRESHRRQTQRRSRATSSPAATCGITN